LRVADRSTFERLCNLGRNNAVWIAALAQQQRAEEREEQGQRRRDEEPIAAQLHHTKEELERVKIEAERAKARQRDAEADNEILRRRIKGEDGAGSGSLF